MIEAEACTKIVLRVLNNGYSKDLFLTQSAIDHCGGQDWVDELLEFYNLKRGAYDAERDGYPVTTA